MQTVKYTELPVAGSFPSMQQLIQEHSLYERRLETFRSKLFLTGSEQLEEVRLKKLKLHAKDLISALEHRTTAMV